MSRVHGVLYGCCYNDVPYNVKRTENRKTVWVCPYYKVWQCMINRCYSTVYKNRFQTYVDVTCCEEWRYFSKFKQWMETQDWEGKVLDKDLLLLGNKLYSPDTCVFISPQLNSFLTTCSARRGEYPLGVSLRKGAIKKPYVACISKHGLGNTTLGYSSDPLDAHMMWVKAKLELCDTFNGECVKAQHGLTTLKSRLVKCIETRQKFEI